MIITVALNPGIEKHLRVNHLSEGLEIPIEEYNLSIASSSVYSAFIMKLLQADPYVLGFAGGIGGRYIKNFLDKSRVKSNLILKDKELRSTFIIETNSDTVTKLVDNQHQFDEVDHRNFKHKLVSQIDDCELLLINGLLDGAFGDQILLDTMLLAKHAHKRTVLFVEGASIEAFLLQKPYAVVLTDKHLETMEQGDVEVKDKLAYLRSLALHHKIHYIFYVTKDQIIGVTKNKIAYGDLGSLQVSDVPWKADAIAGGLAIGVKRKYELEKMVKLLSGISCSLHPKGDQVLCTRKDIDVKANKTKVKVYYANGKYEAIGQEDGL